MCANLFLLYILLFLSAADTLSKASRTQTCQVVGTFPHDRMAFTEGFALSDSTIFESTGIPGRSSLTKIRLETGEVLGSVVLEPDLFGEGVTVLDSLVVQLTWKSGRVFCYRASDLSLLHELKIPFECWGLTTDGEHLIVSDGTSALHFLDPRDCSEVMNILVWDRDSLVENLNELEFVNGEIYANVWLTNQIARISPVTGSVIGWVDCSGLLSKDDSLSIGYEALEGFDLKLPKEKQACLNGIAFDAKENRLFVTGKLWPKIFEVRIIDR